MKWAVVAPNNCDTVEIHTQRFNKVWPLQPAYRTPQRHSPTNTHRQAECSLCSRPFHALRHLKGMHPHKHGENVWNNPPQTKEMTAYITKCTPLWVIKKHCLCIFLMLRTSSQPLSSQRVPALQTHHSLTLSNAANRVIYNQPRKSENHYFSTFD